MKFLSWKEDRWLSKEGSILPYDKLEHFLLAFFATVAGIMIFRLAPVSMIWIGIIAGAGWEIKDGFFSHGFSWKDLIADIIGISSGIILTI